MKRFVNCQLCHSEYKEEYSAPYNVCGDCVKRIQQEGGIMTSRKAKQWKKFADVVAEHVEEYGVKQYGDFPDEQIEEFTAHGIKAKMEYYWRRIGRGQRGKAEAVRDCLKMAHMANYLYWLLTEGSAAAESVEPGGGDEA